MTSQFITAFAKYGRPAIESVFGVTITYERGGVGTESFTANVRKGTAEAFDRQGSIVVFETHEFTFRSACLSLNGVVTKPERNDLIKQTINGVVTSFRVLPDTGLKHYSNNDGHEFDLTVITKKE